jgi:hypothetical protein
MRDPAGSFRISISDQCFRDGEFRQGRIIARHTKYTIVGDNAKEVLDTALDLGLVSRLDHAAYLGSELMRAEHRRVRRGTQRWVKMLCTLRSLAVQSSHKSIRLAATCRPDGLRWQGWGQLGVFLLVYILTATGS